MFSVNFGHLTSFYGISDAYADGFRMAMLSLFHLNVPFRPFITMLNGLNILLTSLTTLDWSDFKSILRTRLFIRRFCQTNGHFSHF